MGRYAYSRPPRRRERRGCLGGIAGLLLVLVLLGLIYVFALRPLISRAVADTIAGPTVPVPTLMPAGTPPPGVATSPQQAADQAVGQAGAMMPTAVAALPPGQVVVTDADLNDLLASRPEVIAPLDSARVRFTGGLARAQISAYGLNSGASIGLAAQDGKVVVTSAQLDAPLSYVISGDEIARALADRLNAELAAQGRRVDDLRIEEGQLVLVTS
jgi:hypothetical protein